VGLGRRPRRSGNGASPGPLVANTVAGVPGRTEYEAVQNYLTPVIDGIRVLSPTAHLIPSPGSRNYSVGAEGYWRLGDENGLALRSQDGRTLTFTASQAYRIVECDPAKHDMSLGCYRVTTTMYMYGLASEGSKLWDIHWHPDGQGDEWRPHLHLPDREHLPTGRLTIEDAVEWCVRFGVEPVVKDWENRLALSKGLHELHRSWSGTPDEPQD
jgi:hypothetical protein